MTPPKSITCHLAIIFLFLFILSACNPDPPEPNPTPIARASATTTAFANATFTAVPSHTPPPITLIVRPSTTFTAVPANTLPTITPTPRPTRTATSEPQPLPFEDNFDDGLDPSWEVIEGEWQTNTEGQAIPIESCSILAIGSPAWNNFALDLDMNIPEGSVLKLLFAYQVVNSTQIWLTSYNNGMNMIEWWRQSGSQLYGITQTGFANMYQVGIRQHLRLEIQNQEVTVHLNGSQIDDFEFSTRYPMPGKIAMSACDEGSQLWIDNFAVTSLSKTNAAVFPETATQPVTLNKVKHRSDQNHKE